MTSGSRAFTELVATRGPYQAADFGFAEDQAWAHADINWEGGCQVVELANNGPRVGQQSNM